MCGLILPHLALYHLEEHERRLHFQWWQGACGGGEALQLAAPGAGGADCVHGLDSRASLPATSGPNSSSGLHDLGTAADDGGAAAARPPMLGRRFHARLCRRWQQLGATPTKAAEREQEAVAQLLLAQPQRTMLRVAAEAAVCSLLAWPVCAAAGAWMSRVPHAF